LLTLSVNPPIILPRYLLKILPQQLITAEPTYLARFLNDIFYFTSLFKVFGIKLRKTN